MNVFNEGQPKKKLKILKLNVFNEGQPQTKIQPKTIKTLVSQSIKVDDFF